MYESVLLRARKQRSTLTRATAAHTDTRQRTRARARNDAHRSACTTTTYTAPASVHAMAKRDAPRRGRRRAGDGARRGAARGRVHLDHPPARSAEERRARAGVHRGARDARVAHAQRSEQRQARHRRRFAGGFAGHVMRVNHARPPPFFSPISSRPRRGCVRPAAPVCTASRSPGWGVFPMAQLVTAQSRARRDEGLGGHAKPSAGGVTDLAAGDSKAVRVSVADPRPPATAGTDEFAMANPLYSGGGTHVERGGAARGSGGGGEGRAKGIPRGRASLTRDGAAEPGDMDDTATPVEREPNFLEVRRAACLVARPCASGACAMCFRERRVLARV